MSRNTVNGAQDRRLPLYQKVLSRLILLAIRSHI